jgi:hypothetical protein
VKTPYLPLYRISWSVPVRGASRANVLALQRIMTDSRPFWFQPTPNAIDPGLGSNREGWSSLTILLISSIRQMPP